MDAFALPPRPRSSSWRPVAWHKSGVFFQLRIPTYGADRSKPRSWRIDLYFPLYCLFSPSPSLLACRATGSPCWLNGIGRKRFSFIFQARSHHPCGSGRVFFFFRPHYSPHTQPRTRGILASDARAECAVVLQGVDNTRAACSTFTTGPARTATRTAVSQRWRPKMGITIIYLLTSPACVSQQPTSKCPAMGKNSRLF